MTKKEAIAHFESVGQLGVRLDEPMTMALAALRREVEREEAERPKRPSLEEQEKQVRMYIRKHGVALPEGRRYEWLEAAADTLKVVREQVVPILRGPWTSYVGQQCDDALRALGVAP